MNKIPDGYRKLEPINSPTFNIGDAVTVSGQKGTIHSPRIYLNTGYGYLVKFSKEYEISNWDFNSIPQANDLLTFRENWIRPAPKTKEVKLNNEYTAIVSKDDVKVGCQTFPYDVIKEIVKAHDSI